jgi:hypothetical protein
VLSLGAGESNTLASEAHSFRRISWTQTYHITIPLQHSSDSSVLLVHRPIKFTLNDNYSVVKYINC